MEPISVHPIVSVVINTRNRCRILHRAIESVLNQTYRNIELVIVDGQSTDETSEVVKRYLEVDSRINYVYIGENKSAVYCINMGMSLSKGDFIAILDDDDEYLPSKIEKQVQLFLKSDPKVGVIYCWDKVWDDRTNSLIRERKNKNRGNIYDKLLFGPGTGASSELMFKRKAIEKVGGWDDSIRFGADYQLTLNIAEFYEYDYVPEILAITHWNHMYMHLTTQSGGNVNQDFIIENYEKVLSDHNKGFEKIPEARYWHYKGIISAGFNSKNYNLVFKYTRLGLFQKSKIKYKINYLIHITKRFIKTFLK